MKELSDHAASPFDQIQIAPTKCDRDMKPTHAPGLGDRAVPVPVPVPVPPPVVSG